MAKQYALADSAALKHARFSIKPLRRPDRPNMGLSDYNMVIHETVIHTDVVACIADGRVKTYITGLNENAPDVQKLPTEEKEAKIAAIRRLVARAEREIEGNYECVDPETKEIEKVKDFWANVKTFRSVVPDVFDNKGVRVNTYWDELQIKLTNNGIILDESSVKDLVIMAVIEAGGFTQIAPSYKDAVEAPVEYKFYLDKRQDTSAIKVADKRLRDKAGSRLTTMYDKHVNKLFYVTKLISSESLFFKTGKNATPNDVFYDECHDYIEGLGIEKNKEVACEHFIRLSDMGLDELKARCLLRDGKSLRFISYKDMEIYHVRTGTIIGKNDEEAVLFLVNPANATVYDSLLGQVQAEWSK